MDDVWNYEAWECVLKTPLVNVLACGSRVVVTTRDIRVARGMMAEEPYHHVKKLEPEVAWSLLKNQVRESSNVRCCSPLVLPQSENSSTLGITMSYSIILPLSFFFFARNRNAGNIHNNLRENCDLK